MRFSRGRWIEREEYNLVLVAVVYLGERTRLPPSGSARVHESQTLDGWVPGAAFIGGERISGHRELRLGEPTTRHQGRHVRDAVRRVQLDLMRYGVPEVLKTVGER